MELWFHVDCSAADGIGDEIDIRSMRYKDGLDPSWELYEGACCDDRNESCSDPNQLSCDAGSFAVKKGDARLIDEAEVEGVRPVVDEDMLARMDVGEG